MPVTLPPFLTDRQLVTLAAMVGHEGEATHDDLHAISDLLDTYAHAIDTRDWVLLATVFSDDAIIDYTASGGPRGPFDEALAFLIPSLAMISMSQHLITNKRIVLDCDAAASTAYFYSPLAVTDESGTTQMLHVGGSYRDVFRRTEHGWRITERVQRNAWFDGALAAGIDLGTSSL